MKAYLTIEFESPNPGVVFLEVVDVLEELGIEAHDTTLSVEGEDPEWTYERILKCEVNRAMEFDESLDIDPEIG